MENARFISKSKFTASVDSLATLITVCYQFKQQNITNVKPWFLIFSVKAMVKANTNTKLHFYAVK